MDRDDVAKAVVQLDDANFQLRKLRESNSRVSREAEQTKTRLEKQIETLEHQHQHVKFQLLDEQRFFSRYIVINGEW